MRKDRPLWATFYLEWLRRASRRSLDITDLWLFFISSVCFGLIPSLLGYEVIVTGKWWVFVLIVFAGVFLLRFLLAPFWIWRDQRKTIEKLSSEVFVEHDGFIRAIETERLSGYTGRTGVYYVFPNIVIINKGPRPAIVSINLHKTVRESGYSILKPISSALDDILNHFISERQHIKELLPDVINIPPGESRRGSLVFFVDAVELDFFACDMAMVLAPQEADFEIRERNTDTLIIAHVRHSMSVRIRLWSEG